MPDFTHPDKWSLVEYKEGEQIWLFRKNLGAATIKDRNLLPTLVYFTIEYRRKDRSGLPDKVDLDILYKFEQEVIPQVEKKAACVYVASAIKNGIKDHLFYVSNPDSFLSSIDTYRDSIKTFKVSIEKNADPKWEVYKDFPEK